jgi:hypothetical protein
MEVAVSPSHYNLKDIVQAIELDAAWYLNTPPDCRIAAPQGDFEFVDFCLVLLQTGQQWGHFVCG